MSVSLPGFPHLVWVFPLSCGGSKYCPVWWDEENVNGHTSSKFESIITRGSNIYNYCEASIRICKVVAFQRRKASTLVH